VPNVCAHTHILLACLTALSAAAVPVSAPGPISPTVSTDSLALDVGVANIMSPGFVLEVGDTAVPRVMVRNYGTETVRYFDVRVVITNDFSNRVYDRTVVIPMLNPNTGAEVRFEPWVSIAGRFVLSCSTALAGDENPANDREVITIQVLRPLSLFIEHSQSDRIEIGETKLFAFHAELRGDLGDSVALLEVTAPPGWRTTLYDSTGSDSLPGIDRHHLGYIPPNTRHAFMLQVQAPTILANTGIPSADTLVVRGMAISDSTVADSALLVLTLEPGLQIHNYPNPLETSTRFVIGLPEDGTLNLIVYDRTGRMIRHVIDSEDISGPVVHEVVWRGTNEQDELVAPGTYTYLLEFIHGDRSDRIIRKLVVARK
jgi:hypothetical protein